MKKDGDIHFYDDVAVRLHDRQVYEVLKLNYEDLHPASVRALLEMLDGHDLEIISSCANWDILDYQLSQLVYSHEKREKPVFQSHRLNYPIEEVLDDYVNKRKWKRREAKRQLKKRFDGLDHDHQEAVMMAFMTQGNPAEREFIYDKLYGEEFWVDGYIPFVQKWWEQYKDPKMAKVIVKRCPRAYVLAHLADLKPYCNYASLCLKTGISPDPEALSGRTYLFVQKSIGGKLRPLEGRDVVLKWVREFLYEEASQPYRSIYDIPYVRRMLLYLGEMGLTDDILALEVFDKQMAGTPHDEWNNAAIKAIEKELSLSEEYIFRHVK
jgi:hypothetical protein